MISLGQNRCSVTKPIVSLWEKPGGVGVVKRMTVEASDCHKFQVELEYTDSDTYNRTLLMITGGHVPKKVMVRNSSITFLGTYRNGTTWV